MTESTQSKNQKTDTEALPFAAPCRDLPTNAPVRWIKLGWQDMCKAPGPSLGYGVLLVLLSYLLAALAVGFQLRPDQQQAGQLGDLRKGAFGGNDGVGQDFDLEKAD